MLLFRLAGPTFTILMQSAHFGYSHFQYWIVTCYCFHFWHRNRNTVTDRQHRLRHKQFWCNNKSPESHFSMMLLCTLYIVVYCVHVCVCVRLYVVFVVAFFLALILSRYCMHYCFNIIRCNCLKHLCMRSSWQIQYVPASATDHAWHNIYVSIWLCACDHSFASFVRAH